MNNKQNANDQMNDYFSTENYYKVVGNLMMTDGAKDFCEKFKCWWFLDIITSYQHSLRNNRFQVWKIVLNKTGNGAKVICEDGNNKVLITQRIPFTDFEYQTGTLWCCDNIILLPSEY